MIFLTKNERGMFQWVKTRRREKHMREGSLLRKHADGKAGPDGKSLFVGPPPPMAASVKKKKQQQQRLARQKWKKKTK